MNRDDDKFAKHPLLAPALQIAVPVEIRKLRRCPDKERQQLASECGQVITEHGDDLLYASKKKGDTARAFNALAKGLAALAYQPGGVTFAGLHWCVGSGHSGTRDEYPCDAEIAREEREKRKDGEAA